MARALIVAQETLKRKEQRLIEAERKIQKDAPKVLFADAVSTSHRSCLIAELAKILQQNGVISVRTVCLAGCARMVIFVKKVTTTISRRRNL